MKTVELIQGSQEWHAHRAQHFNASDAPAMMGCSPYQTRADLLARLKTGIAPEVDAATQRRFDDGHRFEALARPLAERIIGEDLYAVTGTNGKLSASFDGLTLLEDKVFEHKSLNAELRRVFDDIDTVAPEHREATAASLLPLHYRVQLEQQLLVSGAALALFMASKWAGDNLELIEARHCWYLPDASLRAQIVAGWEQFERDLAEFVPTPVEVKPIGKTPETLPALHIVIQGGVSASNLEEFRATALGAIQSVNRELTTDVHFADAEKAVKWCSDIEDRIKAAKEHALGQTASIDALFRTMDDISAEARRVRLDLDKLVKARKESIRADIVSGALSALTQHLSELNAAMPADYMPRVLADFAGAIKGLRTVESIQNAAATELARAKIEAGQIATRIHANLKTIEAAGLVAGDVATLVLKAPDDLAAVIAQRLAAEKAKEEAQRARIIAQEQARLEAEARAKVQAEEAERKVREAAEVMALRREQEEAEKLKAVSAVVDLATIAVDPLPFITATDADARLTLGQVLPITPARFEQLQTTTRAFVKALQDEKPTLKLGEISARLGFTVTADFLESLGFAAQVERSAKLYRPSDFLAICAALQKQIAAAADNFTTEAVEA